MASKSSKSSRLRIIADFKFVSGLIVVFFLMIGIFTALRINSGSLDVSTMAATKGAQCSSGQKTCQTDANGVNTGYQCVCNSLGSWTCTTKTSSCAPSSGGTTSTVTCTAINGTKYSSGQGVCTTLNGQRNGNYCTCIDAGGVGATCTAGKTCDTGTWRCVVNGTRCPIEVSDVRVIASGSSTNCSGANSVNPNTGSLTAPIGASIYQYFCPTKTLAEATSGGCQENGVKVAGNTATFTSRCGAQQIDVVSSAGTCFYSTYIPCTTTVPTRPPITITPTRIIPSFTPTVTSTYTPSPTRTPTPTPTTPTRTPTPTPMLVCEAMRAYRDGEDITNKLNLIKMGNKVVFKGFASNTQTVKSMTFQVTVDGAIKAKEIAPVVLARNIWVASFNYHFNSYGNHVVKIISINK